MNSKGEGITPEGEPQQVSPHAFSHEALGKLWQMTPPIAGNANKPWYPASLTALLSQLRMQTGI